MQMGCTMGAMVPGQRFFSLESPAHSLQSVAADGDGNNIRAGAS